MKQHRVSTLYIAVVLGGLISAGGWWLLAEISRGLPPQTVTGLMENSPGWARGFVAELKHGFWYEKDNNDMPTAVFLTLQALLGLVMLGVFLMLHRQRSAPYVTWVIALFALVFRVLMLGSVPIHENDFYRYIWDGKVLSNGINPYLYEPAAIFLYEAGIDTPYVDPESGAELRGRSWSPEDIKRLDRLVELRDDNQLLYERIGHRHIPTIYPPLAQGFFALSSLCFEDSVLGMKIMFVIFDLGCMGLIVALLILLKRSTAAVILYAWSPLILVEFSNSGHYDAIPLFFLLLTICFALGGQRVLSALAAALGVLAKFFSALVVPILHPPRRWSALGLYALVALVAAGSFWPFALWQEAGFAQVFRGLGDYARDWQKNSFVFLLVDGKMGQESYEPAKIAIGAFFLVCVAVLAFWPGEERIDKLRKCFLAVALLFVLLPTSFPWYFAWVAPFLCFFPSPSLILLMFTVSAYYLDFHDDYGWKNGEFLGIPVLNWITWGPFLFFALAEGLMLAIDGRQQRVRKVAAAE